MNKTSKAMYTITLCSTVLNFQQNCHFCIVFVSAHVNILHGVIKHGQGFFNIYIQAEGRVK